MKTNKKYRVSICISILLFLYGTSSAQTNKTYNWAGEYSYQVSGPIAYTLTIGNDNICIYQGEGIQTFFKVSCKGKLVDKKYKLYYKETLEGAFYPADWIDKSKPLMTLYYNGGILYTDEGQLNKEKTGGQLLFKKSNNKQGKQVVYVCPMHPDETSPIPGKCPKCGMDYELKK